MAAQPVPLPERSPVDSISELGYWPEELAKILRKSLRTLRDWAQRGYGPPFTEVGNTRFYPKRGLVEWLDGQPQQKRPSRQQRRGPSRRSR